MSTVTAQHTPGSWHCLAVEGGYLITAPTLSWRKIASVPERKATSAEDYANAHLIAAAPALLAALEAVLGDAEGFARTHGAGDGATRRIHERCDQARAAIAQAKGEE